MYLVLMDDADQRFNSPEFYTPKELHDWLHKYKLYGTYQRFVGKHMLSLQIIIKLSYRLYGEKEGVL